ncbi:ABC transporter permease [Alteromonas sp. ASW11-36]|uniref:ABC transporter permease n=1 Tax=Alteromonas arenosi TaxID=3055817 RepID=A0ABT7SVA5_9ALTE|nr:ABC transporter permease [Alteromonas sp. ASW11-36]MDM7860085.1 ABC transporter permease [Alteromonas sp. ASW11-36]
MIKILLRYTNLLVLTLLVVVIFSFALAYLFPGEPYTNLTGVIDEQAAAAHQNLSVTSAFWQYLGNIFAGDWGLSLMTGQSLADEIAITLPATLELSLYALAFALLVGLPIGFWAGLKPHKGIDYSVLGASAVMHSFPVFWLAMLLVLIFSLQFGWLPMSGRLNLLMDVPNVSGFIFVDIFLADNIDRSQAAWDAVKHLALPTFCVSIITMATIIRAVRRSTLEVMHKPFIIAAQSRGLSNAQIFFKHGFRNALLPILPILAMQVTTIITNVMIVESIFSWPGIGNWLLQAIYQQDYPAIRAGMLAVAGAVIVVTILIELFNRIIDPSREKFEDVTF